ETVSVRSGPSGAVVYLDGKPIGTTPLDYSLPRSEVGEPHRVRVEKTGYAPVESDLRTRWAKGRVTGAVFTLGLLALIRPMRCVAGRSLGDFERRSTLDQHVGEDRRAIP